MSSSSFECTHIRTTSNVACIMDPRHQRRLENIECRMSLSPFDCTHGQATYGVVCFSSPWTRYTVGRYQAWHLILALEYHTRSNDVEHGILPWPLDSTYAHKMSGVALHISPWKVHSVGMKSGVACHHGPWKTYTVRQHLVWHARFVNGKHTLSDDVWRCMPS